MVSLGGYGDWVRIQFICGINPHLRFCRRLLARFLKYLNWRFVCVDHVLLQQFGAQNVIHRFQIVVCRVDHPACQRVPRQCNSVFLKVPFLPVQREDIQILFSYHISNESNRGVPRFDFWAT